MFEHYQGSQVESYLNFGIFGLIFGIFILLYYLFLEEKEQKVFETPKNYASASVGSNTTKPTNSTINVGGTLGGM